MEFITDRHQKCPVFYYIQACDQTIFKGKTECNLNTLTTHNYIFLYIPK